MKLILALVSVALLVISFCPRTLLAQTRETQEVEFCNLLAEPSAFSGKMVTVTAMAQKHGQTYLFHRECLGFTKVLVALPQSSGRSVHFELVVNDHFRNLLKLAGRGYFITGVFEGKFEHYRYTGNQEKRRFGNKGSYAMRLILYRVKDFKAYRMPTID